MIPLFDHQQTAIEFSHSRERILDASDPGTGKTRVAIECFVTRRRRGGGRALILAPKSLLGPAWGADIRKFAPHLTYSIAYATNREVAFWKNADVYITNHDAASWLAKRPAAFFKDFDTLIIDESGAFKHASSQRSKAVNKIKKYFTYRTALNGTVTPNSITDIWNQAFILDDGVRLGSSFYGFRMAVCTPQQVGPSASMVRWTDREGASDAVTKLLADITIRNKFEECISIPENHEYSVEYQLSEKQLKAYEQMAALHIAGLDTGVVSAVNAAVVMTKLLQIASGAVYEDPETYHIVDTGRYELALDLIESRQHSIAFFMWKHQKDQLIAEANRRKIPYCLIDGTVSSAERERVVAHYQAGFYRVLFAHPQSAAHGLTLTKGTATIWVSPTFNLDFYMQGLKRIYRAGQTKRTETISIIAPGTVEEKVWTALQSKRVRMDEILSGLITSYKEANVR